MFKKCLRKTAKGCPKHEHIIQEKNPNLDHLAEKSLITTIWNYSNAKTNYFKRMYLLILIGRHQTKSS